MQLQSARLCLDCDEVHDAQQCPSCASETFAFITRWVPVPGPDRPHKRPRSQEVSSTEALGVYRWFRPRLDLDVSTYLVQNIKLAEVFAIGTNDRVRLPRKPHSGERRAAIERLVKDAIATRPELPKI